MPTQKAKGQLDVPAESLSIPACLLAASLFGLQWHRLYLLSLHDPPFPLTVPT